MKKDLHLENLMLNYKKWQAPFFDAEIKVACLNHSDIVAGFCIAEN